MKILIATSEDNWTEESSIKLASSHHEFVMLGDRYSFFEEASCVPFEVIFVDSGFLDLQNLNFDSRQTLREIKGRFPNSKFVIMSSAEEVERIIPLVKDLADDYIAYPLQYEELNLVIDRLSSRERRQAELEYLRDQFWDPESALLVKTECPEMKLLFERVKDVAPTRSTVLLQGETGVGKGVLARLIHKHSERRNGQLIHVHCGAITESLVESELFGHEKGAFTGAEKRKLGKFELAHKGTIFLDEVSTLTASAQVKLLQVLQDSCFQRVGGEVDVKVDVRVIAASNEELKELVGRGTFRADLFFRLNVFPITIPSLKDRRDDLSSIIENLLTKYNALYSKEILGVQPEALSSLQNYDWPGNIRELENLIERAYIIEKSNLIGVESLPLEFSRPNDDQFVLPLNSSLPLSEARSRMVQNFERQYVKEILAQTNGRVGEAAKIAGVGTRQLHKLMTKYGISKDEFKSELKIAGPA